MDFGQPNAEIGRKMASDWLLFLALSLMLQLANHSNIAFYKESLLLLHPLDDFEHYGLLKRLNISI